MAQLHYVFQCQKSKLWYNCLGHNSRFVVLTEDSEAKEPSFLRKLREESGGGGSLRHERPKKQRAGDDDDDEPTYVDEEGRNTMSRAEYESLMGHQTRPDKEGVSTELKDTEVTQRSVAGDLVDPGDRPVRIKQQVTEIGAQKRRKAIKVIGDDAEDHKHIETKLVSTGSRLDKKPNKRKKVKLSFDEDPDA